MNHPDDEFHPPTEDHPEWTETMWFAYAVPERDLSGQLYVFARRNVGVVAAGAFVWDRVDDLFQSCRYSKMFWQLPFPDSPLSDLSLDNGLRVRATDPLQTYELTYDDPDGDAFHLAFRFDALVAPHYLHTHYDQPGRYTGRLVLDGQEIEVDGFGFRDRSWGVRRQFGEGVVAHAEYAAYSYGTASPDDAFFTMQADFSGGPSGEVSTNIHGFLLRDGELSALSGGSRRVVERSPAGHPARVEIEGTDALGRSFVVTGSARNSLPIQLNPNLFTINGLYDWSLDGAAAYGEDHDNWSVAGYRKFVHRAR